jgi:hypothetical protein
VSRSEKGGKIGSAQPREVLQMIGYAQFPSQAECVFHLRSRSRQYEMGID